MTYSNYKLQIIVRVSLIVATGVVLSWLIANTDLVASMVMITIVLVLQALSLIRYVDRVNWSFIQFIETIKNKDFTFHYPRGKLGRTYELLFKELNDAIRMLREQSINNESERLFLQSIVENASAGLMAFNQDGDVEFLNMEARRILGIKPIKRIDELDQVDPSLLRSLKKITPGNLTIIDFGHDHGMRRISLISNQLVVRGRRIDSIIIQDITSELNRNELAAWQQLIKVITHEIVNSVTPIASLASSSKGYMEKFINGGNGHRSMTASDCDNLYKAITTIERRSLGLQKFVSSYRKLNQIPRPEFEIVKVGELFARINDLLTDERYRRQNLEIDYLVVPTNLEISADPVLMEQVLLNLLINAKEAIGDKENGKIILSAALESSGNVLLSVKDNGKGIDGNLVDSIFTPFFTTKAEGSGLGLSISKQIINLHGAKIDMKSIPGRETTFNIRF